MDLFCLFSHLFLPTMTVRYKKKKAQLHLMTTRS